MRDVCIQKALFATFSPIVRHPKSNAKGGVVCVQVVANVMVAKQRVPLTGRLLIYEETADEAVIVLS